MSSFILDAISGAVATFAGASLLRKNKKQSGIPKSTDAETQAPKDENERLKKRYNESEQHNEDLTMQISQLYVRIRLLEEQAEDLQNEKESLNNTIIHLRFALEESERKTKEYKMTCKYLQDELDALKEQK